MSNSHKDTSPTTLDRKLSGLWLALFCNANLTKNLHLVFTSFNTFQLFWFQLCIKFCVKIFTYYICISTQILMVEEYTLPSTNALYCIAVFKFRYLRFPLDNKLLKHLPFHKPFCSLPFHMSFLLHQAKLPNLNFSSSVWWLSRWAQTVSASLRE